MTDAGFLYNAVGPLGTVKLQPNLDDINHEDIIWAPKHAARVTKVVFCKCLGKLTEFDHEFILCYLEETSRAASRGSLRHSVVLIERNGEDDPTTGTLSAIQDGTADGGIETGEANGAARPPPARAASDKQTQASRSSKSSPPNFRSSSSSSSSSRRKSAGDVIVFPRSGNEDFVQSREGDYEKMKELRFPERSEFSLLQLVFLVHAIYSFEPEYSFRTYNCYWMARAVYESLQLLVPAAQEHVKPSDELTSRTPGKFRGLSPLTPAHTADDYTTKFKEVWAGVEKKIEEDRILANKPLQELQEERERRQKEREGRMQAEANAQQAEANAQQAAADAQQAAAEARKFKDENRRLRELLEGRRVTSVPVAQRAA